MRCESETCRIRASSSESLRARGAFIASPTYLAARNAPANLADLGRHDVISGPADGGDEIWVGRRNGRVERQAVSPRIRARSATGVLACAVAGLGIAIGSSWMCADALASGEVIEILADYDLDPVTAYVVFPAGRSPRKGHAPSATTSRRLLARPGKTSGVQAGPAIDTPSARARKPPPALQPFHE